MQGLSSTIQCSQQNNFFGQYCNPHKFTTQLTYSETTHFLVMSTFLFTVTAKDLIMSFNALFKVMPSRRFIIAIVLWVPSKFSVSF